MAALAGRRGRVAVSVSPAAAPSGLSIPDTMRAAVLFGPRDLRVVWKPVPVPGPADVLVKVAMCGTCGTDLAIQDRPFPGQPPFGSFTPGHEWTGVVVARGETVDEVAVGDRVAIHVHHGCGRCRNCLNGSYTACLNYGNVAKGHRASGFTVDGGFAQYVTHHASSIYRLPDQLDWEDAVLVTTAGTAMYGIDRAGGLVAGDTVVVVGPGSVGLTTLQVVRALGAGVTIAVGTRDERLALATRTGADHVVNSRQTDPVARVRELTGGRGADLVIETSGHPTTPELSLRMVRRGGSLLFLAFYDEPVNFDIGRANREEVRLVTSRGEGRTAVGRVLRLAASGAVRGADLVTHRYPLERIQEGFEALRAKAGDPIKVVFTP
ncbi:zinc-dependent alcohol dehydrogenase [Phytohabitans suffuscus]|uniref:Alcohol dehydrogenase n=1 Tax=Phytohabitans suffuscus TaxID=624315 RepID=A0A6F8YZS1_9ACTN|nr:alcohol dehydrogenase catalytic domain-containing protein [Phytohabitans suffuscus]BCB91321.1 alcohol dehydrogenase [Phytohabitans suffuscus]